MAKAKKRGANYQLTAYCGYDADGKQKKFTKTWKPAPEMSAKQAAREAERQAEIFENECRNGKIMTSEISLKDFCGMYLEDMRGVLAERTHSYYVSVIKKAILPAFSGLKVNEITPLHVQKFINQLNGTGVSAATVKRKLAVLKAILTLAVKRDIIGISPARAEKLTMPKVHKKEIEIFSRQETAEIMEKSRCEALSFQLIIQLALMTGARRGEICALKFGDFDFERCTVTISRSAYQVTGEPVKTKAPKSNKDRILAVTPEILRLVSALKANSGAGGEDWIFTGRNGKLMHPQRITDRFRKFLQKNGLPMKKFHTLRHTCATLMLYGGVDVKQVQARLGHGNLQTTQNYLHCLPDADREAVGVLQELLIKPVICRKEPKKSGKTG